MKRYIIVTKRGREVLTTSPTLIADYKVALQSLKRSVVHQLNNLNGINYTLNTYLDYVDYLDYYVERVGYDRYIIYSNFTDEVERIISIKQITIK